MSATDPFGPRLDRWSLTRDGDAVVTATSALLPVRRFGAPALQWIAAFAGLSVLWAQEDGVPEPGRLDVAALALAELSG